MPVVANIMQLESRHPHKLAALFGCCNRRDVEDGSGFVFPCGMNC